MPKGKKVCPSCLAILGVRVLKCDCGHVFGGFTPVPKSTIEETPPPVSIPIPAPVIEPPVKAEVPVVKPVVKAEVPVVKPVVKAEVPVVKPEVKSKPKPKKFQEPSQSDSYPRIIRPGKIDPTYAPRGECPVKLTGFDSDTLLQWVFDLQNAAYNNQQIYAKEAYVYWLRYFVNMNSKEYNQVKEDLLEILEQHV